MKEEIVAKDAPQAIGPYSQAIKVGNLLFCSGQIGVDQKTNNLVGATIGEQTKQAFENLKSVLEAGGADFNSVVKVNVYLKNMDDFSAMNEIYAKYFTKPYPARATVEVAKLPKGALIEVECIAQTKEPADAKAMAGERGCCGGDSDCNCC